MFKVFRRCCKNIVLPFILPGSVRDKALLWQVQSQEIQGSGAVPDQSGLWLHHAESASQGIVKAVLNIVCWDTGHSSESLRVNQDDNSGVMTLRLSISTLRCQTKISRRCFLLLTRTRTVELGLSRDRNLVTITHQNLSQLVRVPVHGPAPRHRRGVGLPLLQLRPGAPHLVRGGAGQESAQGHQWDPRDGGLGEDRSDEDKVSLICKDILLGLVRPKASVPTLNLHRRVVFQD